MFKTVVYGIMAHKEKKFSLNFRKTESDSALLNIPLSWSQPDISSLCVMMFQPRHKLERIWIIRNVEGEDEWTAERTIGTDNDVEFLVYGLKSVSEDQHGDSYEVLISGCIAVDKGKWNDKSRILTLKEHLVDTSILMKKIGLDEFTVTSKFSAPPRNYRLNLPPEEDFLGQRDIVMVLGQACTEYLVFTKISSSGVVVPQILPSRCTYKGLVVEIHPELKSYKSLRTSGKFTLKTVMTKEELTQLKTKAEQFIMGSSSHEVKIMFRNKPRKKMDEIMKEHNGLMEKYIKDNNGDQYSPVNGNIEGLFFSVSLDRYTGGFPNFSYFGDTRLHVPVEALFTDDTNLYFTDFYCHKYAHYVTAVLTKRGTDTDNFCEESLLLLDQHDNQFLYRADGKVHTTKHLHVEVLYTEDVNIKRLQAQYGTSVVKLTTTPNAYGESRPNGIPKRSCCSVCNL